MKSHDISSAAYSKTCLYLQPHFHKDRVSKYEGVGKGCIRRDTHIILDIVIKWVNNGSLSFGSDCNMGPHVSFPHL